MTQDNLDKSITTHAPSVIQVSSDKLVPLLIVLSILCGMSIAVSFITYSMLRDRVINAETETRMLEYYVQGQDALMVANGLKDPGDDFSKFKARKK